MCKIEYRKDNIRSLVGVLLPAGEDGIFFLFDDTFSTSNSQISTRLTADVNVLNDPLYASDY